MKTVFAVPVVCVFVVTCGWAQDSPPKQYAAEDYLRADLFRSDSVGGTVMNETVVPHWLDDGEAFWYRRDTAAGHEFLIVESATGDRRPAFDHQVVGAALNELLEEEITAATLPFETFSFSDDQRGIDFQHANERYSCSSEKGSCTVESEIAPNPAELISPDGRWAAFQRNDNLWLRDVESGDERALTADGGAYYTDGKLQDSSLVTVRFKNLGFVPPPYATVWAPDSSKIVVTRLDERHVKAMPFVQFAPPDGNLRPVLHELKYSLTGEEPPRSDVFIIDVATRKAVRVDLPEDAGISVAATEMWWSNDERRLYAIGAQGVGGDHRMLAEVDTVTGNVRRVIEETSDTHMHLNSLMYFAPNVRVIGGGEEVIWFSQRAGWGHLYLYDGATGELKNQITAGDWLVHDITRIDEANRVVFFTAGGREQGRDPYYRHLYRIGFDGKGLRLLTPENAYHEWVGAPPGGSPTRGGNAAPSRISPNNRYFVDTYSTVARPPVSVLRSALDGELIATLEKADAKALYELGWQPPEQFTVKAADGKTDLYGVIYLPSDFDPTGTYPVIDSFYGGPQTAVTPRTYSQSYKPRFPRGGRSLAELGFVVVTLDSRGTIYRSRSFHDYSYLNVGEYGLKDQIAAIRQLAERYPAMDLERVGIYGHSFGGYGSVRAILAHPDFFKVAVSSAGVHNFASIYHGFEIFMGVPDYGDGRTIAFDSREYPENYRPVDNRDLVKSLKGNLLIAWGEIDENVPPNTVVQLVDALIKADKRFDVLYLPNAHHGFAIDEYFNHRLWDYFVEHLMGAEPPSN